MYTEAFWKPRVFGGLPGNGKEENYQGKKHPKAPGSSFKYQESDIRGQAGRKDDELGRKTQGEDAVDLGFQPPGDQY